MELWIDYLFGKRYFVKFCCIFKVVTLCRSEKCALGHSEEEELKPHFLSLSQGLLNSMFCFWLPLLNPSLVHT